VQERHRESTTAHDAVCKCELHGNSHRPARISRFRQARAHDFPCTTGRRLPPSRHLADDPIAWPQDGRPRRSRCTGDPASVRDTNQWPPDAGDGCTRPALLGCERSNPRRTRSYTLCTSTDNCRRTYGTATQVTSARNGCIPLSFLLEATSRIGQNVCSIRSPRDPRIRPLACGCLRSRPGPNGR
jgi:hypothetical protein